MSIDSFWLQIVKVHAKCDFMLNCDLLRLEAPPSNRRKLLSNPAVITETVWTRQGAWEMRMLECLHVDLSPRKGIVQS